MKQQIKILQNERQKFFNHLTQIGIKLSARREIVFQAAMNFHGHFAAEELVKRCRKESRNVSRATVYRSLRELLEAGVIRETAFGEKHQHYEHVYDEKLHHHARCIRCYTMIEIPCSKEEETFLGSLKKHNFQVLGHELHFYGICRNCQQGQN